MNKLIKSVLIVAAVCMVTAPAMADITAKWDNSTTNYSVTVYDPTYPAAGSTHYTAAFGWIFTQQGTPDARLPGTFRAFCVDLSQLIASGNVSTYAIVDPQYVPVPEQDPPMEQPMGPARADYLGRFINKYWSSLTDGVNDALDNAGFQLAVWELVYEDFDYDTETYGSLTLASGSLKATAGAATTRANDMLAGDWQNNPSSGFYGLAHQPEEGDPLGYGQDFITVPVPGAILLGLFGFSLIGWIKRRFA